MKPLVCDICGGQLVMDNNGEFAVCESCGMKYTKESIRSKVQEITGTVRIDNAESERRDIENWIRLAGDAFNNSNYDEAYGYYCRILEKNVNDWAATYRKGLCLGWKSTLQNMRTNEVTGGITDAAKLLDADEALSDAEKADGRLLMAKEYLAWIKAVADMVVNHADEFANKLKSAANEYYMRETIIAGLVKICISMIDEHVCLDCTDRSELDKFTASLCSFAGKTISRMDKSFRIKTGTKYNTFWENYDDVFTDIKPDSDTYFARKTLQKQLDDFKAFLRKMQGVYKKIQAEEKEKMERENQEKIRKYMEEHPDIAVSYKAKAADITRAQEQKNYAQEQLQICQRNYTEIFTEWQKQKETVKSYEDEMASLSGKIFAKKKNNDKISELQAMLQGAQNDLDTLDMKLNEVEQELREKQRACQSADKEYTEAVAAQKLFLKKYGI